MSTRCRTASTQHRRLQRSFGLVFVVLKLFEDWTLASRAAATTAIALHCLFEEFGRGARCPQEVHTRGTRIANVQRVLGGVNKRKSCIEGSARPLEEPRRAC
ncbi:hypothetical protein BD309DRAFT_696560 [Dichomitus squalens]|nr:hypothetical protein BD309DRAFT_696560 [Dichomitus squalens]